MSRWNKVDLLLAALGFGLLAGIIEAIAQTIRQRVLDRTLFLGPDYLWQLPVADAAIFLLLGGVLLLVSFLWVPLRGARVGVAIFGGLTALSALMLTERIHLVDLNGAVAGKRIAVLGFGTCGLHASAASASR